MASKKKNKGLFDYVSCKDVKSMKKRGFKPSYIKMSMVVRDMNIEIIKKRNKKSI